jgi:hypothetical protein
MEAFTYVEASPEEIETARRLVRAEREIAALTRRLVEIEEWLEDVAGDVAGALSGVVA